MLVKLPLGVLVTMDTFSNFQFRVLSLLLVLAKINTVIDYGPCSDRYQVFLDLGPISSMANFKLKPIPAGTRSTFTLICMHIYRGNSNCGRATDRSHFGINFGPRSTVSQYYLLYMHTHKSLITF